MTQKTGRIILGLVGLLFLLAGAGTGIYLVQQRSTQDNRSKATVSGGSGNIKLDPASPTVPVGSTVDVNILFNGGATSVSSTNVRISFPDDGTFSVTGQPQPNQSLITNNQWRYDTRSAESQNGNWVIDIGAFDTSPDGYNSPSDTVLATFTLKALKDGVSTLQFDTGVTKLMSKADGNDFLSDNINPAGTFTAGAGGAEPTPTETSEPAPTETLPPTGPTNTIAPNPTATTAPTPTNEPNPSPTTSVGGSNNNGVCNLTCSTDSQCTGGLVCIANQCRNNSCQGDSDCNCDTGSTGTAISVTSPADGASLTTRRPVFKGTAAPGARIQITINSTTPVTGTVTANSAGNWTWTPPSSLAISSHTATFVAYDNQNRQTTANLSFSILGSGSSTGTTADNTPVASASGSLPVSGEVLPTLALLLTGLLFLLAGAVSYRFW